MVVSVLFPVCMKQDRNALEKCRWTKMQRDEDAGAEMQETKIQELPV